MHSILSLNFPYTVIARDEVPKQSKNEIPRGVYPEQKDEILRFSQNDMRMARNDSHGKVIFGTGQW